MNSDRPELAFEWNKNKAKMNIAKHKVSFEEARTVSVDRKHPRNAPGGLANPPETPGICQSRAGGDTDFR